MSNPTNIHQPGLDARVFVKTGLALICLAGVFGIIVAIIYAQIDNVSVEVGSLSTGLSMITNRVSGHHG